MSDKLSYSKFISDIQQASAFDLYRLRCAITTEMESTKKSINAINKLYVGMKTQYFDSIKNKSCDCIIEKINKNRVMILDIFSNKRYSIPYYMINIDSSDTSIDFDNRNKLSKNELCVGDLVSFNHKGLINNGIIKRLNTKTATILTTDKQQWRVAYEFLSVFIDGELSDENSWESLKNEKLPICN